MMHQLPYNLMVMFSPRTKLPYVPPIAAKPAMPPYTGIGDLVNMFEDPKTVPPMEEGHPFETKPKRKMRKNKSKLDAHREKLAELIKACERSCEI